MKKRFDQLFRLQYRILKQNLELFINAPLLHKIYWEICKDCGSTSDTNTHIKQYFRVNGNDLFFGDLTVVLTKPQVLAYPNFLKPLFMETDSSSFALEVSLSQIDDGWKLHSVQYTSRTMNAAVKNYWVCERKHWRSNLHLWKFSTIFFPPKPSHSLRTMKLSNRYSDGKMFTGE